MARNEVGALGDGATYKVKKDTVDTGFTWTPKVCRRMAFWAIFKGFGPLFYLLWGFR